MKRSRKPTPADFERSIPVDIDDSDWWLREPRSVLTEAAFKVVAPYASREREAEDAREIRTGRLMR